MHGNLAMYFAGLTNLSLARPFIANPELERSDPASGVMR